MLCKKFYLDDNSFEKLTFINCCFDKLSISNNYNLLNYLNLLLNLKPSEKENIEIKKEIPNDIDSKINNAALLIHQYLEKIDNRETIEKEKNTYNYELLNKLEKELFEPMD